jgi:hypothetical protein
MEATKFNINTPPIITVVSRTKITPPPIYKMKKEYTLKHFVLFFLTDFISIGLLVVISEFFF